MQLRKFEIDSDFEEMKEWVTDERTHAMWCANLIKYPLSKDNLAETLKVFADRFGDVPYVAISDDGKVGGFFCYKDESWGRCNMIYDKERTECRV